MNQQANGEAAADPAILLNQQPEPKGRSLWGDAYKRLKKDRMAIFCLGIVIVYSFIALAARLGLIATPWDRVVGAAYGPPSMASRELWLGTDIFGRSVFYKMIQGTRIAMSVGFSILAFVSAWIFSKGNWKTRTV